MRELAGLDDIQIEGGDLALVSGADALAQRLTEKLRLFRGEWFLDTRIGVPWFRDVLGSKSPRGEVVQGAIRQPILDDDEVIEITRFEIDFDGDTRKVRMDMGIRSVYGDQQILETLEV